QGGGGHVEVPVVRAERDLARPPDGPSPRTAGLAPLPVAQTRRRTRSLAERARARVAREDRHRAAVVRLTEDPGGCVDAATIWADRHCDRAGGRAGAEAARRGTTGGAGQHGVPAEAALRVGKLGKRAAAPSSWVTAPVRRSRANAPSEPKPKDPSASEPAT